MIRVLGFGLLALVVVAAVVGLVYAMAAEDRACHRSGGQLRQTGVVVVSTGKVITVTPIYSCVHGGAE